MHTLIMISSGIVLLVLFVLAARLINRVRSQGFVDGARIFIWVWLVVSLVNMGVGVFVAGVSVPTEVIVLLAVFGVPATLAWLVSHRMRR